MARKLLYKTAETEMIARIDKGDWEVGRRLPNEFELADEFGVSQGTMRRALISLEGMGYLDRKPGRGTLVTHCAPAPPAAAAAAVAVAAQPRLIGPDGAPLRLEPFRARAATRAANAGEADLFGAARLATLDRTLKWNGDRAALEEIVVPASRLPGLPEDLPTDFAECLDALGLGPARITITAQAAVTDMAQSVALSVDRHTGLLRLTSTARENNGRAVARQVLTLAVNGARLTTD